MTPAVSSSSSPAVHSGHNGALARSPFQDYRAPAFYMVTITTHERRPWFGVCQDNACTLNADGWIIHELWHRISRDYPQIATSTLCIMPDHLHGILHVKERMEKSVGVAIRAFKSQATVEMRRRQNNPALTLWNPGYNDRCVWRRGTLPAFTNYIQDNPRRYCLKKAHPDLFRTVTHLQHPCMPPLSGNCAWSAYGNRFLLDRPEKRALRVSRTATAAETAALKTGILRDAAQGTVIVSPFISPGERDIALAILDAPAGAVITLKPVPFPPHYKPQGKYFDLCCEGRLLLLSPGIEEKELSRSTCLFLNHCANALATHNSPLP